VRNGEAKSASAKNIGRIGQKHRPKTSAKNIGQKHRPKTSALPGAKRFSAQRAVPAPKAQMPNQSANAADFERDGVR
jgi:hypothetical protein